MEVSDLFTEDVQTLVRLDRSPDSEGTLTRAGIGSTRGGRSVNGGAGHDSTDKRSSCSIRRRRLRGRPGAGAGSDLGARLIAHLRRVGLDVDDLIDSSVVPWRPYRDDPRARGDAGRQRS